MDSIERTNKKLDMLIEYLGEEHLLDALCRALGTFILEEHLDYIARVEDIDFDLEG